MSGFIYFSNRWSKYFIKNLFTDELELCPESVFNDLVINYRHLYTMEYDGANAQNFFIDGRLEARRER